VLSKSAKMTALPFCSRGESDQTPNVMPRPVQSRMLTLHEQLMVGRQVKFGKTCTPFVQFPGSDTPCLGRSTEATSIKPAHINRLVRVANIIHRIRIGAQQSSSS
jgi:hypothetical protein